MKRPSWRHPNNYRKNLCFSRYFSTNLEGTVKIKNLTHIIGENTNFFHFRFRAILHLNSISVNTWTFLPFETGSLTRSEKLLSYFSIIPYPLKNVLILKYGRKKNIYSCRQDFTTSTLVKGPSWRHPNNYPKNLCFFQCFSTNLIGTLKFKNLTHIHG